MRKQDVIDYCLKTPYNTNPNLLNQFIDEMDISGSTAPLVERDGAKIYGVVIDTYADRLDQAMTYIFDAVNIQPGPDSWFERWSFNLIKPCIFNNGEVMYYLDKNNFNKRELGGSRVLGLNDAPFFGIGSDYDCTLGFKSFGNMEGGDSWGFVFGKGFKLLTDGNLFNTSIGASGGIWEECAGSRFMYL